jgi:hypothetical protein
MESVSDIIVSVLPFSDLQSILKKNKTWEVLSDIGIILPIKDCTGVLISP